MKIDHEGIKRKLIQKKEELAKIVEALLLETTSGNLGELSTLDTNHLVDTAMNMINKEQIAGKLESIKVMLINIDHALAKLEKNVEKFGLCERCNKQIEEQRLQALPWARYCIGCKRKLDKRR
ncbi:MAG: TraR/DksA C4-type zinc finger protein [Acetomicrobium sp.]